ncbi:exodeoxyribonuclease VII large subunit [candidate division WOR-3 bacterium]|uniref:Exodeoxyribonuclease 7 large subunit n=1 Tax=candidate division WOR-3 bacterium TaxID=2052148 RepID=A0A937XFS3_UNCW3|nr:exodeoxyribonuclease VII large subunit [candidate division WOR-3 bacterium]
MAGALDPLNPGPLESTPGRRVLSVSQVNKLVAGMLGEHFSDVWIEGEISNFRAYASGHRYFALKDEGSQLQAVCFRHSAQRLKFELEDGLQVVAHGRLEVYQPTGKYQVILDVIEPKGLGALQKAFEQLKRKLEKEGLFAAERKRPLPSLPRTVGIVTSPSGAAIHDMLKTLRLHKAQVKVVLFPAQVQGEGAAEQIAEGVATLCARPDVDVIIVGRGGGSIEDLWSFNEEAVARAIAASRVPVISGVGHETDFTIADFVADVRAATPTAAAQLVARPWEELETRLSDTAGKLLEAVEQLLFEKQQAVDELTRHRAFELVAADLANLGHRVERMASAAEGAARASLRDAVTVLTVLDRSLNSLNPVARILRQKVALQALVARLEKPTLAFLFRQNVRLGQAGARLDALSPLASLGRGYSICLKPDGSIVSRIGEVEVGEGVHLRVSDGAIDCRVERTGEN